MNLGTPAACILIFVPGLLRGDILHDDKAQSRTYGPAARLAIHGADESPLDGSRTTDPGSVFGKGKPSGPGPSRSQCVGELDRSCKLQAIWDGSFPHSYRLTFGFATALLSVRPGPAAVNFDLRRRAREGAGGNFASRAPANNFFLPEPGPSSLNTVLH